MKSLHPSTFCLFVSIVGWASVAGWCVEPSSAPQRMVRPAPLIHAKPYCRAKAGQIFAEDGRYHGLGLIGEDPREIKEWKKREVSPNMALAPLPSSVINTTYLPPVGNQGAQGSCVGWAIGYYNLTYFEAKRLNWSPVAVGHQFSPAYIYNQGRSVPDNGMYFRDATQILGTLGCATLDVMPYDQSNDTAWPSEGSYMEAMYHKIGTVTWIDTTQAGALDAIKQHLANGDIGFAGIYVYPNFSSISSYGYNYCLAEATGNSRGGHATTIVGYDDNRVTNDGVGAFFCVNSWGTDWGALGYYWLSYQAVTDANHRICQGSFAYWDIPQVTSPVYAAKLQVSYSQARDLVFRLGSGSSSFSVFDLTSWREGPSRAQAIAMPGYPIWVDVSALQGPAYSVSVTDGYNMDISGTLQSFSLVNLASGQELQACSLPAAISPLDNPTPISNGGFEAGNLTDWQAQVYGAGSPPAVSTDHPHAGGYDCLISSTGTQYGNPWINRTLAVPTQPVALGGWVYPVQNQPGAGDLQYSYVQASSSYANYYLASENIASWKQIFVDISPWAGQSLYFEVGAVHDGTTTGSTSLYADDFALWQEHPATASVGAIALSPSSLPNGTIGAAYSQSLTATGGTAPYNYFVTYGTLPSGLTLNQATGALEGSPSALGHFSFVATAVDFNGCGGNRQYALDICAGPAIAPTVTGTSSGCAYQGVALSTQAYSTYQWNKDGAAISGAVSQGYVAMQSGTYSVTVVDACGFGATSPGHAVTLSQGPAPVIFGQAANSCPENSVVLYAGVYSSYQWNLNGTPLTGATGQSYTATSSGAYTVVVLDGSGCRGVSSPFQVTINECASACSGWSWANPKPDGNSFYSVAYGSGKYVAVGQYGKVATSPDGAAWTARISGTTKDLWGVAWGNGRFVAAGLGGTIVTSTDGLSWNASISGTTADFMGCAWVNGQFIALGIRRSILTSPDGITWTIRNADGTNAEYLSGVAWSGSRYVVVGGDWGSYPPYKSLILTSSDGLSWNAQRITPYYSNDYGAYWLNAVVWNGAFFMAVGDSGLAMSSADGLTWSQLNADMGTPSLQSLIWDGSEFVAPDYQGTGIFSSANGASWAQLTALPTISLPLYGICQGDSISHLVAVGLGSAVGSGQSSWTSYPFAGEASNYLFGIAGGDLGAGKPAVGVGYDLMTGGSVLLTSNDGTTWAKNSFTPSTGYWFYGVAYSAGRYVAVGPNTTANSGDGANWSEVGVSANLLGVAASNTMFVAVGTVGRVFYSVNSGASWTQATSVTTQRLRGVTYDAAINLWVAIGDAGTVLTSPDGIAWTPRGSGTTNALYAVTSGNWSFSSGETGHVIVAVGALGTILTSPDGIAWSARASNTLMTLRGVARGAGQFEAVGAGGMIVTSMDGITWSREASGAAAFLTAVSYGAPGSGGAPGEYFAAGYYGAIIHKQALRANASASPASGGLPLTSSFSALAQGGQAPFSYEWDFGDGAPHSDAQNPGHRYVAAGAFGVTLTVRDCNGMIAMDKLVVTAGGSNVYRVPYSITPLKAVSGDHGVSATITWDASNCASDGYHLIYGYGSGLSSWTVSGGACGLGAAGTAQWTSIPDPAADSSRLIWFLVVGDNGLSVEGSWGTNSSGQERGGGPSGVCGFTNSASGDCGTYPSVAQK